MATVTSKGQITLPKAVRDALGLQPGAEVEFQIEGGQAVLRRRVPDEAFARWRGRLSAPAGRTRTDDLIHELRGE
jgi:antitoxin PrlF